MSRIAITGANGYIGSRLAAKLATRGNEVILLCRKQAVVMPPRSQWVRYDLDQGVAKLVLKELAIDALIHCAHDFRRGREVANLKATRALLNDAQEVGIATRVFVSSTAAFEGCRSSYGKVKLASENLARGAGAWIVRPGFVVGNPAGGLAARLAALGERCSALPLPGAGTAPLYPVWEDDLLELLANLLEHRGPAGSEPIVASASTPTDLCGMIRYLAGTRGPGLVLIPTPWRLSWAGLRLLEAIGLNLGLRSDSIVSLIHAASTTSFETRDAWRVRFREFADFPVLKPVK